VKLGPFEITIGKPRALAKSRRGYSGAATSRLLADFNPSGTSADTEIQASLAKLRNRTRELARNNDYVKSAIRVIKTNVVGEGIPFQSQVKQQRGNKLDSKKNAEIENLWYEWTRAENCHVAGKYSFNDLESVIIGNVPVNGEVLVRVHRQRFGSSKIPFSLELLESDMLDETYNEIFPDTGNEVRMGVEFDKWGRPVAYHFHSKHPGDYAHTVIYARGHRVRVPAQDIYHLFLPVFERQARGIPWFHTAIKTLHHMGGYQESEIVSARATASLMGFIESPEGELQGDGVDGDQRVTEFEPGVFKQLKAGEKINVPTLQRPGGQFEPFMRFMIRSVSSGIGASYESISRDYSQSNYSSSRQALLEDRDNWRALQQWMIRNFQQRVYEDFLDAAYLSNTVALPGYAVKPALYRNPKWMPRGWGWVDPSKEIAALKDAVRCGFMTLTQVIAQSGGDFDEVIATRKREIDTCAELGLVFDTDAKLVSSAGLTNAKPAGSEIVDPNASGSESPTATISPAESK